MELWRRLSKQELLAILLATFLVLYGLNFTFAKSQETAITATQATSRAGVTSTRDRMAPEELGVNLPLAQEAEALSDSKTEPMTTETDLVAMQTSSMITSKSNSSEQISAEPIATVLSVTEPTITKVPTTQSSTDTWNPIAFNVSPSYENESLQCRRINTLL